MGQNKLTDYWIFDQIVIKATVYPLLSTKEYYTALHRIIEYSDLEGDPHGSWISTPGCTQDHTESIGLLQAGVQPLHSIFTCYVILKYLVNRTEDSLLYLFFNCSDFSIAEMEHNRENIELVENRKNINTSKRNTINYITFFL